MIRIIFVFVVVALDDGAVIVFLYFDVGRLAVVLVVVPHRKLRVAAGQSQ